MGKLTDEQYERFEKEEAQKDVISRLSEAADAVRLCRRKGEDGKYCVEGWLGKVIQKDNKEYPVAYRCECYERYRRILREAHQAQADIPSYCFKLSAPLPPHLGLTPEQKVWQDKKMEELRQMLKGFGEWE